MNIRPAFFPLAVVLAIVFAACGPSYSYKEYKEIKEGKWYYKDSLVYDFTINDTSKIYNLYLDVEHSDTFAYQNAYVKLHTLFPNGQKLDQQLSLELANKAGVWNEKSSGGKVKSLIALQQGAFFNHAGKYKLTIEQFMRVDPVLGINKVGFLVEKTDVSKAEFLKGNSKRKKN